ncbi:DNA polymerase, partial [Klebsiella pneumoniae]|nr:DNA polymerase [Klebsiella pneumoniae]
MRLTKIHRGIKFTANPYLAKYIDNNTNKRNMYKKDDVKKNFYKLMNNSPYGKTIESAARRSDIRLLNDPEKARRLAEKPHCVDFRIFDRDLIGIEMRKCH